MLASLLTMSVSAQNKLNETMRHYLSGNGVDQKVEWDFFCTEGRNSGKWDKIEVPSCWEQQGYGIYQYGITFYGKPFPDGIASEKGMYKYEFEVPADWNGNNIELVFEASMTDTEVKINGRKAGPTHQGAFYRFSYDITDKLKFGKKNLLEVTVSKESLNAGVNLAERRADYWNFGGIFRPVFLQVRPSFHINHLNIDAKADGSFKANCHLNIATVKPTNVKVEILDVKGKKVAEKTVAVKQSSDWASIELGVQNPILWSAETPNLYSARFTLMDGNNVIHHTTQRFGFRTVEVRESDGLYINGVRVNIRGVNRHSFRPETARTLTRENNYEDVRLIKDMNMNSVRLSHYPADPEFLEACDELGLYVMNELAGWHGKYDTPTGTFLIEGMVKRDVNHASVIWWANGNEKGWNTELDGEFHKWDPQNRPVIHPQGNFSGFETMHYRSYGESQEYMRLPEIFMPTEFLHGLYDGGHGAGLYDYWEMMRKHPRCIGGFLWVMADEGVKRIDQNGRIDNQGNYGADGIVGPNHEKEGSYFTIKQVWSPVQIMDTELPDNFNGVFNVENRYDFTNLSKCKFTYQIVELPKVYDLNGKAKVLKEQTFVGPDVAPHQTGKLDIKIDLSGYTSAHALYVKAEDTNGSELWRWGWNLKNNPTTTAKVSSSKAVEYKETATLIDVAAGDVLFSFSKEDGELKKVTKAGKTISLANGPRFTAAKRADRSLDQFYNHDDEMAKKKDRTYLEFTDVAKLSSINATQKDGDVIVDIQYKLGNLQSVKWTLSADGKAQMDYAYSFDGVVELMGIKFDYPEGNVLSKRWKGAGPYRVWQNRIHGTTFDVWENDYNDPIPGESFLYPEFKGYFADWQWVNLKTSEGVITLENCKPENKQFMGIYQPRDGRDALLYTLPQTGISVLDVIPAVRNKVNSTDLCGPSSQAKWVNGVKTGTLRIDFNL